ncbi:MAG: acetyl-CoA carboxylase biotin carboxylase subunit [Anaerolineales bacterium]|uniref:biotin carboxylase n=1 Tax=Candidatus Desulfolinea nitratireducens TaxID=2841698 RepID=A0A8J6NHH1_9CHLR|nr:acetyl-CoA carboxylase biotin carboxylase subunit [Candidatus Desulfolinea nitratireducens]
MKRTPFKKILVANRGEIAIRIIRACQELDIRTVSVYSEADADALHVRHADEAVLIGPPAPLESYLNIEKLLNAARETGAEAIHPGYGFLSENADFAEAVRTEGLTFIGPPVDAIRIMGDKAESKIRMKAAGVPTIPGAEGIETLAEFEKASDKIGYPVLVKAAAGGGGKGMRVVWEKSELPEGIESARREALNAFGDETLLVEKYLPSARHIEFQVFGDQHGHITHLFERECSVQRRHQKIIEETPSPLLNDELRQKMGAAAIAVAQAVNYYNAGTVEFIVDPETDEFYFLEMNTRLQVEHPVTEMVLGIDLVQWQIRVAAGEAFPYEAEDLNPRGHAIEARLYAEDPANSFLPSTGVILKFGEPGGPGIRVDSGIATGSEISHYYDPMLAKIIVHAEDRGTAIQRLQNALRNSIVHGVITNVDFLQAILGHDAFQAGTVTTRWVEEIFGEWKPSPNIPHEVLIAAALADLVQPAITIGGNASQVSSPDPFSPWKKASGFRLRRSK